MKKISYMYYVLILLSTNRSFSLDISKTTIVPVLKYVESGMPLVKNIYDISFEKKIRDKTVYKKSFFKILASESFKKKVFTLCGLGLLLISLKYQEKKCKKIVSSLEKYCTEGVVRPVVFSLILISGVSLMDVITKKDEKSALTFLQYCLINVAIFFSVAIMWKLGVRIEPVLSLVSVIKFCCHCWFGEQKMEKFDFTMLDILLYCREGSNMLNGFEAYLSFFLLLNTFKYFTYEMKEALLKEA